MDDLIVLYNGEYWWPRNDGGSGGITEEYASEDSTCYGILNYLLDVPSLVSNFVTEKKVVLQAGGNCGIFPIKYSELFETVYTFEPDPVLFHCLSRNVKSQNIIKFQAALGNERNLISTKNDVVTSCGGTHIGGTNGIIPTLLIDDLNLQRLDLIHLDIEGYEYNALRGGMDTIKRCKPIICIEYFSRWLERYGHNIEQIETLLRSLDYIYIGEVMGDRIYKYKPPAVQPVKPKLSFLRNKIYSGFQINLRSPV